jgi:hypothetical protein
MNAKSMVQELGRIRRDIGSSLRPGHDAPEPAPRVSWPFRGTWRLVFATRSASGSLRRWMRG